MAKKKAKKASKRIRIKQVTQKMIARYMYLWENHKGLGVDELNEYLDLDQAIIKNSALPWIVAGWKEKCVQRNDLEKAYKTSVKSFHALKASFNDLQVGFDNLKRWSTIYERQSNKFKSLLVEAQAQIGRLTMQLSRHRHVSDISDQNIEIEPIWNSDMQRPTECDGSQNGKSVSQ